MILKFFSRSVSASLALVLILMLSSAAFAQDSAKVESRDIPELFEPVRTRAQAQPPQADQYLALARRLISQKKYADAAAVLENLAATSGTTPNIENLLVTCYIRTNNNLMAERLLRSLTIKHPGSLGLVRQLAEQLILLGQKEAGLEQYSIAFGLTSFDLLIQSDQLLRSMVEHGLEDRALEIIDSIRADRNDNFLYAVRRGTILERRADYAKAAKEYYRILDKDSTVQGITAERRLLSMLKFPASTKPVETALLEQVRLTNNQAVLKLLNSHYINAGQFDYAFELSVQQDSLLRETQLDSHDSLNARATLVADNRRGSLLLQFILQCVDRNEYDQIIRMANFMKTSLSAGTFTIPATTYKAAALSSLKRYAEAVTTYESLFEQVLDQPGQADLLYRIGEVYMNGLRDYSSALKNFDSVTIHYQRGMGFLSSLKAIPVCHFRMGQFSLAADGFKRLSERFQVDREMERQEFHLALIDLALEQYDSCGARLQKLVVLYPNGLYVNDAVELMMINQQSAEQPDQRQKLYQAVIYDWRQLPDSARTVFAEIANNSDNSMADFALYRLAKLEMELGRETEAAAAAEQLINRFETSYFFPIALKLKADILVRKKSGMAAARDIYFRILSDFPNYPFATQIRKALRSLETSLEPKDKTGRS